MNISTLTELKEITPNQLLDLKTKALEKYYTEYNISSEAKLTVNYHIFKYDGGSEDILESDEKEALILLEKFSRCLTNDEVILELYIEANKPFFEEDKMDMLIKFQRTDKDVELINKIKNKVESYHDMENYITRVYDQKDCEVHAFYAFNRTEHEAESEAIGEISKDSYNNEASGEGNEKAGYDWTLTKIEMYEWVRDEFQVEESHAKELVALILNKEL